MALSQQPDPFILFPQVNGARPPTSLTPRISAVAPCAGPTHWRWLCQTIASVICALVIVSCSSTQLSRAPSGAPLSTTPPSLRIAPLASAIDEPLAEGATFSLDQLIAIAKRSSSNPLLFAANQRAAQAQITQARAWANPELEVEGARARTTDNETVGVGRIALRQRFELPSKRSSRIAAAEAGIAVIHTEARLLDLDLVTDVRMTAYEVVLAQLAVEQGKAVLDVTHLVADIVNKRVSVGEASRSDALRVQVEALQVDQEQENREQENVASRAALNTLCGGMLPRHYSVDLTVDALPILTLDDAITLTRQGHPDITRLLAIAAQHRSEISREQSAALPDVSVGVLGGRETDSRDVGVSLAIDVPLWNRNQGGIEAARADVARTQADLAATTVRLQREVQAAWFEYERARITAERYVKALSPAAAESLRFALSTYQSGETGLLDILDARRTAQGVDDARLDALRQAQVARARLERAMGVTSLTGSQSSTTPGVFP